MHARGLPLGLASPPMPHPTPRVVCVCVSHVRPFHSTVEVYVEAGEGIPGSQCACESD